MAKKLSIKAIKSLPGFMQKKYLKHKCTCFKKVTNSPLRLFLYKSDDPQNKVCSINYMYVKDNLKNAENIVNTSKVKTKKKKKWNIILFLCNIVVLTVLLVVNFSQDAGAMVLSFKDINYWWLLIAFGVSLVEIGIEVVKYLGLIYSTTKQIRPYLSYKVSALGRYYDNITPLGSGGQPFQIYYLNKRGVHGDNATSIPLARLVLWQISFVIINIFILIFKFNTVFGNSVEFNVILTIAIISLVLNSVVVATVLFLSISKKWAPKFIVWCLKLLYKMKLVKDYKVQYRKTLNFVREYQLSIKKLIKDIPWLIVQVILAVVQIFVFASIPYFILHAFLPAAQMETVNIFNIISQSLICQLAVVVIPTPGGVIASELSFLALFSNYLGLASPQATLAMLFYRIITYYYILIQGLVVISYDFVYGDKKNAKLLKAGKFKSGKDH